MQGIDIAKAPVRFQPIIKVADTKPQDGFISKDEAVQASGLVSDYLGIGSAPFTENDKAMEYMMKVMGVELVKMPEVAVKVE